MEKEIVMLARKEPITEKEAEQYKNWIKEPKIDGDRFLWVNEMLINRRQINRTDDFKHIKIENKDTIVDGEIAFLDNGIFNFNVGRRKENWDKCRFYVFDVIKFEGKNLTDKPLKERKEHLKLIKGKNIVLIDDVDEKYSKEGFMLKNPNSKYVFDRSDDIIKVKFWKYETIKVNAYEQNPNSTITATNGKDRVLCSKNPMKVKEDIDNKGFAEIPIKYLEETINGFKRFICEA